MEDVTGIAPAIVKKAAILCLLPLLVACSGAPDAAHELVSQDSLSGFLADLTSIQPYSGWRNSATEGEAEALDYVAAKLGDLTYLQGLGLELERQSFLVFNSTELWETRLRLTVGGQEVEVPADSMRGNRDDNALALRFDSDGNPNDSERNPVVVAGPIVLVRSAADIDSLAGTDLTDSILFVDYAVADSILLRSGERADELAAQVLALQPAGLVLVTTFSNQTNESHGAFVGDTSGFTRVPATPQATVCPILYTRLEDLAPAGIAGGWDGLAQVEAARLTWDLDVFSPGASQNLIGRIPGDDASQAVILGAHIDSPNSPGALDDGSGSAVLLEVARVLDAAKAQPPVDLYLAWFGSHEIGLYGSSHFIATHQELLDRTLAMLQVDCLTRPIDGAKAEITLKSWPYGLL
ncbi:MAG TPA: M28 family peptidase, partial [Anaerolineae bacterium]|nr:M28 family peptidase [Anaerolineae bacterium]